MHEGARAFIAQKVKELGPFQNVLEIGSRNVNGSVRDFFPDSEYTGLDRIPGSGVDVVADAVEWSTLRQYDCIVCCEVFEHEPRWAQLLERIGAWLGYGAVALVTMATDGRPAHAAFDGGPLRGGEFYGNISVPDFLLACADAGVVAALDTHNPGDLYAVLRRGSS